MQISIVPNDCEIVKTKVLRESKNSIVPNCSELFRIVPNCSELFRMIVKLFFTVPLKRNCKKKSRQRTYNMAPSAPQALLSGFLLCNRFPVIYRAVVVQYNENDVMYEKSIGCI